MNTAAQYYFFAELINDFHEFSLLPIPWYLIIEDENQMVLTKYPWKYFSLELVELFELI